MTADPNYSRWRSTVNIALRDSGINRLFSKIVIPGMSRKQFIDSIIKDLAHDTSEYACDWAGRAKKNRDAGLYRKVLEFVNPSSDDLLIDLGCGTGDLFLELGRDKVVGVDLNPYCLEAAEKALLAAGRVVRRYSRSYIGSDPDKGLVLVPDQITDELNFNQTNLVCDDITTLDNLVSVLGDVRADAVINLCFGGVAPLSSINFIDTVFKRLQGLKTGYEMNPFKHLEKIMQRAPEILKPGGKFYFGFRISTGNYDISSVFCEMGVSKRTIDQMMDSRRLIIPMENEEHGNIALFRAGHPRVQLQYKPNSSAYELVLFELNPHN